MPSIRIVDEVKKRNASLAKASTMRKNDVAITLDMDKRSASGNKLRTGTHQSSEHRVGPDEDLFSTDDAERNVLRNMTSSLTRDHALL